VSYQTQLANALRARGVAVEEYAGWTTHGKESFNPGGALCHWTAGPCGATGRPSLNTVRNGRHDLPGPLANIYLDRDGVGVVVAAGVANHAGEGSWGGLSGNSSVFGVEAECCNAGDWTPAQRAAYPLVMAALCDAGGFGADMVCGHHEWTSRKIDPHDWTMAAMRTQVADELAGAVPPRPMEAPKPMNHLMCVETLPGYQPWYLCDFAAGTAHRIWHGEQLNILATDPFINQLSGVQASRVLEGLTITGEGEDREDTTVGY
jgi:hypothetical protein